MKKLGLLWVIAGTLGFGTCGQPSVAAGVDLPPLEPPAVAPRGEDRVEPVGKLPEAANPPETAGTRSPQGPRTYHEAATSVTQVAPAVHIDRAPPAPVVERPGVNAPAADAQWIDGYWDWDPVHKDFVWVTGTWRIPPAGRFWVNGYWKRDELGWYRAPGFWSERKTDVRRNGPPSEMREDPVGQAPGPDYFFIPGQYVPGGDGATWRPGFWARSQPGWEWVPSRWVRLSGGWTYREGHWERSGNEVAPGATPTRDLVPTAGSAIVSAPFNPSRPGAGAGVAGDPGTNARRRVVARPVPGPTSPFGTNTPPGDGTSEPNPATDLAPLPEGGLTPLPEASPPATSGEERSPAPGPDPGPTPTPTPRPGEPVYPDPRMVLPGIAVNPFLPFTELNLPGVHIRVGPGPLPGVGNLPVPYPSVVVPRVEVRVRRPLQGVRDRIRDRIFGPFP